MSSDQRLKLAQLTRIRAQRRHSRERDFAERGIARVNAENALAQQHSALLAAVHGLKRDTRAVTATVMSQMLTGEQIAGYLALVERMRSSVATEQAATAAASAIVDTIRQDERKAQIALRNAAIAERKVETMHQRVEVSDRQCAAARADLVVDELSMSAAARVAAGR